MFVCVLHHLLRMVIEVCTLADLCYTHHLTPTWVTALLYPVLTKPTLILVKLSIIVYIYFSAVTWRKGRTGEIKDSTNHMRMAERGQHSLRITQMKPSDAGSYTIIATNTTGQASSTATIFIKSGKVRFFYDLPLFFHFYHSSYKMIHTHRDTNVLHLFHHFFHFFSFVLSCIVLLW